MNFRRVSLRMVAATAAIAVVAVVALLVMWRGAGDRGVRGTPVILISIDTLRSDRLPAYGYTKVETPHLDAFRADSILYEHAYSHCPLTLPAHASMLTGLLPAEHGIRDNIGFTLRGDVPMLPELLRRNGYTTGAAISAFVLRKETGMNRGFDFYDDQVEPLGASQIIGRVQRGGGETIRASLPWITQNAARPFFFFLHLYDPHSPYTPPEPFRSRYRNEPYDGEIAYVDQVLGEFFAHLKQIGVYDKAMIIVLSDHGEGLNDHGEEEHGIFLYREAIQVPLIVKMPRSRHAGTSVKAPAALVDVFPTILEGTATAPPRVVGADALSLTSLLRKDAPVRRIYSESYYPKLHFGWSDLHSLIDGESHYIRAPIPELYDLTNDFEEKKNVLEEKRRIYNSMRVAIEPYVKEAEAPAAIDPEEAAKLAALGYVGSTVATAPGEELPDPKTTIDVFHQIRVAFTHFRNEELEECLELTNRLLADNHRMLDLWDLKSKALAKMGRNHEAIAAAKEGLKQQPSTVALLSAVANLSILTGNLEDAEAHADLLMKPEPGQAHEILARIYAERSDFARAEQEARLAIATGREATNALMTLALISKQKNDLQGAMSFLDEALQTIAHKRNRRVPNLHFYRGDVLARLGRAREAEAEFRREIAMYPTHPDAYASLLLLLVAEGRAQEGTAVVFDLVRASPRPPSYIVLSETLKAVGDDRGALYWAYQGLQKFPDHAELRTLVQQMMKDGRA